MTSARSTPRKMWLANGGRAFVIVGRVRAVLEHVSGQHQHHVVVRRRSCPPRRAAASPPASPPTPARSRCRRGRRSRAHRRSHRRRRRAPCRAMRATSARAFFHDAGAPILIAVAVVSACTGIRSRLVAERARERRGSGRLHDRQARQPIDPAQRVRFAKAFAQRAGVAEISARQDDPIRHAPAALFEQHEGRRLLAFDPVRVDRVDDRDALRIERAHRDQRRVEIAVDREDRGAVIERLRDLRCADPGRRHEHDRSDPAPAPHMPPSTPRCCRCSRRSQPRAAVARRARNRDRHAGVLERRGRVHAEMQVREPARCRRIRRRAAHRTAARRPRAASRSLRAESAGKSSR